MYPLRTLSAAIAVALLLPAPRILRGEAEEARALSCPPPADRIQLPERPPDVGPQATDIRAGHFLARPNQSVHFSDGVRLTRGGQRLEAEVLIYDPRTGAVLIPSWLTFSDPRIRIEADNARYDSRRQQGRFNAVTYQIPETTGSGSAAQVELIDPDHVRLTTFDFTTCPPEQLDWQLKASRVNLDLDEGVGTARNARLTFKGVPVLYSPWMSFPLNDQRKSGFLYPGFGYSGDDGLDISVPWYWNIAPNQDATFTPRWIQDRGAMLGIEHRFLTGRQRSEFNLQWLPDDRRAERSRYYGEFSYRARPAPRWSARANLRRASDDDYFIDLGSDLTDSAIQFLRSSAELTGRGRFWTLGLMADTFQVLDKSVGPASEPYRRLPRATFSMNRPLSGRFRVTLDSELVYFDRDEGVTGARLDLLPRVHYDWVAPGWHVRPALGFRSTAYELDAAEESSINRTLPIASVDAGLAFERSMADGWTQTLEPRLYYLYVPFRDQDRIPGFDTRELTFGFSQLFHYNRFSGPDRQGDANQLTVAVNSRLLDPGDGRSRLDVGIGQIFYFSDLDVQLPGQPAEQRGQSATVAEMTWRPARQLALRAGLQWDSETDETEVARLGLSYRGQGQRQAALGYRFRRDRVDQADARFRYPLNEKLNLIGRVTYSFEENETLEVLGGIEYESCCWALRLTAREWIRDRDSDKRTTVFLELQLKGLGSVGREPYELFADRP